jgi:hypothetical protein
VWEDGKIELKSRAYPVETTAAKIQGLPIGAELRDELCTILRTGNIPPARENKEYH